jgi:hypothetical protein
MKHEITMTSDKTTREHVVHLAVTDAPDYDGRYSPFPLAPERVVLRWMKYDEEEWENPRVTIFGKRRLKGGGLGADARDSYASRNIDWLVPIIEEVQPS